MAASACSNAEDTSESQGGAGAMSADAAAAEPDAASGDAERGAAAGPSEPSAVAGRFQLTLVPEVAATADLPATPAYTALLGRVYEGAVPQGVAWTVTAEEGDCELLEPSIPACDPACSGGAVCVEADRCAEFPRAFDVGTVTLRGLRGENVPDAIAIDALPPSNSYQLPGSVKLSYPPFAEGDALTLDAAGGELAAFSIATTAIAPLAVSGQGALEFSADAATELRWAPPADAPAARVIVRVDISHHGGQKGEIVCDTDDDGMLAIPAALGARLIDLGVAGYPTLQIAREAVGTAAVGSGRVELAVSSPVTIELEIPGLVSCDEPGAAAGCPDGQECQLDRRCQ